MSQILTTCKIEKKPTYKYNIFINIIKEIKTNYSFFILLLPGFILVFILNYLPMVGIVLAFKKYQLIDRNFFINLFKCEWVGFDNFWLFFHDKNFFSAMRVTIGYNIMFMITGTTISLIIALVINEISNKKMAKFYHSCMLLPNFLSWVVFSYVVFAFLGMEHGFINNSILVPLGFKEISWYMEPKYWPFILFIVNTIKSAGVGSILYLSAIVGLDPEYFELARIYGASKWQQIRMITLPLISNVIIILLILNLGHILSADFGLFYNIPMRSAYIREATNTVDIYIYYLLQTSELSKSAAAGLFKSVIGMLTVLLTNFTVRKIDKEKALF